MPDLFHLAKDIAGMHPHMSQHLALALQIEEVAAQIWEAVKLTTPQITGLGDYASLPVNVKARYRQVATAAVLSESALDRLRASVRTIDRVVNTVEASGGEPLSDMERTIAASAARHAIYAYPEELIRGWEKVQREFASAPRDARDDAHERASTRARLNDFSETNGKDWT